MASLRDIRKRIASVKNTQKITNAMKMVSAAKLQACGRSYQGRPSIRRQNAGSADVLGRTGESQRASYAGSAAGSEKVLLILITADRGLCGAFNASLNRRAEAFIKGNEGQGHRGGSHQGGPQGK